jgi:hypothetical protein
MISRQISGMLERLKHRFSHSLILFIPDYVPVNPLAAPSAAIHLFYSILFCSSIYAQHSPQDPFKTTWAKPSLFMTNYGLLVNAGSIAQRHT